MHTDVFKGILYVQSAIRFHDTSIREQLVAILTFRSVMTSSALNALFQQTMFHKLPLIISRWCYVTVICYGLDGPWIESRWGRFCTPVQTAVYNKYHVSSPSVNRPGRDVDCLPPPGSEVIERVQLYHCSPSWTVLGRPLPFSRSQTDGQSLLKVLRLYFVYNVYSLCLMQVSYETHKHIMCLQNAEVFWRYSRWYVWLTLQRGVAGTARMLHALTHSSISRQVREQM